VFSNIKNIEFQFVFYRLCLDVMNRFCKLGNYDFEQQWNAFAWPSPPANLVEALPEIARSQTVEIFLALVQNLPCFMWESACMSLLQERIAQVARVAILGQDETLSRKFARFPTVDAAAKLVATDAMAYFETTQAPVSLHGRVVSFFAPLRDFVEESLDMHLAEHNRSFDLSPHATDFYQKLYVKDHELFVMRAELVAAQELVHGLHLQVQSMQVQSMQVQSMQVQTMQVQSMQVQSMQVQSMPVQSMPVQSMPVQSMLAVEADVQASNLRAREVAKNSDTALQQTIKNLTVQHARELQESSSALLDLHNASSRESCKQLEKMTKKCQTSNAEGKRLHAENVRGRQERLLLEQENAALLEAAVHLEVATAEIEATMRALAGVGATLHTEKTILINDIKEMYREIYDQRVTTQQILGMRVPTLRADELPNVSIRPTKPSFHLGDVDHKDLHYLGYLVRDALMGLGDDRRVSAPVAFGTLVRYIEFLLTGNNTTLMCPFRTIAVQMLVACPRFEQNLSFVTTAHNSDDNSKTTFFKWWNQQCSNTLDRLQTIPATHEDFRTTLSCLYDSPSDQKTFELLHGLLYWMVGEHVSAEDSMTIENCLQCDDKCVLMRIREVVRACLSANCSISNVFRMLCFDTCLYVQQGRSTMLSCSCITCEVPGTRHLAISLCKLRCGERLPRAEGPHG